MRVLAVVEMEGRKCHVMKGRGVKRKAQLAVQYRPHECKVDVRIRSILYRWCGTCRGRITCLSQSPPSHTCLIDKLYFTPHPPSTSRTSELCQTVALTFCVIIPAPPPNKNHAPSRHAQPPHETAPSKLPYCLLRHTKPHLHRREGGCATPSFQ
jgi:hypothetical protein